MDNAHENVKLNLSDMSTITPQAARIESPIHKVIAFTNDTKYDKIVSWIR